jgi:RNA polymerase sigma-70 factor (ECF subfamily)
LPSE